MNKAAEHSVQCRFQAGSAFRALVLPGKLPAQLRTLGMQLSRESGDRKVPRVSTDLVKGLAEHPSLTWLEALVVVIFCYLPL